MSQPADDARIAQMEAAVAQVDTATLQEALHDLRRRRYNLVTLISAEATAEVGAATRAIKAELDRRASPR